MSIRCKAEPSPPSVRRAMSVDEGSTRYDYMALLAEGWGVWPSVL